MDLLGLRVPHVVLGLSNEFHVDDMGLLIFLLLAYKASFSRLSFSMLLPLYTRHIYNTVAVFASIQNGTFIHLR